MDKVLALDPNHIGALYEKGNVLNKVNKFNEADV